MLTNKQVSSLNKVELNVYHYVLENKESTLTLTIRELASASHVSPSVVFNFCKKAGCSGYSEFKFKLKTYLTPGSAHHMYGPDNGSPISEVLKQLETGSEEHKLIDMAVAKLSAAQNIIFTGVGQSGIMAKYGAIYFSNFGIASHYIGDALFRVPANSKGDLLVALSASGENTEIIYRIEKFKDMQIPVIAITNTPDSTIAKLSDINLNYHVPAQDFLEFKTTGDVHISLTSQIAVVYYLEHLAKRVHEKQATPLA